MDCFRKSYVVTLVLYRTVRYESVKKCTVDTHAYGAAREDILTHVLPQVERCYCATRECDANFITPLKMSRGNFRKRQFATYSFKRQKMSHEMVRSQ